MSTHKQLSNTRLTQKTVEVADVRVTMQRDKSHSPSGDEKKQSRCLRFDSETRWWISVIQKRTDAADAVPEREAKAHPSPESSEEDRDSTVTACTGNDAIRNQAHDAGKDLRRARYSQSGCCQDCQRNSQSWEHRMSLVRDSRYHPASIMQAIEM